MNNSVPGFRLMDESTTIAMCGDEATMTTIDSTEEVVEEVVGRVMEVVGIMGCGVTE